MTTILHYVAGGCVVVAISGALLLLAWWLIGPSGDGPLSAEDTATLAAVQSWNPKHAKTPGAGTPPPAPGEARQAGREVTADPVVTGAAPGRAEDRASLPPQTAPGPDRAGADMPPVTTAPCAAAVVAKGDSTGPGAPGPRRAAGRSLGEITAGPAPHLGECDGGAGSIPAPPPAVPDAQWFGRCPADEAAGDFPGHTRYECPPGRPRPDVPRPGSAGEQLPAANEGRTGPGHHAAGRLARLRRKRRDADEFAGCLTPAMLEAACSTAALLARAETLLAGAM